MATNSKLKFYVKCHDHMARAIIVFAISMIAAIASWSLYSVDLGYLAAQFAICALCYIAGCITIQYEALQAME